MREAEVNDDGTVECPYVTCPVGVLSIDVDGVDGRGVRVVWGTCTTCGRVSEVVEGVEQLELDGVGEVAS